MARRSSRSLASQSWLNQPLNTPSEVCASADMSFSCTARSAASLTRGFASTARMNPSLYAAQMYASDNPEYAGAKVGLSLIAVLLGYRAGHAL